MPDDRLSSVEEGLRLANVQQAVSALTEHVHSASQDMSHMAAQPRRCKSTWHSLRPKSLRWRRRPVRKQKAGASKRRETEALGVWSSRTPRLRCRTFCRAAGGDEHQTRRGPRSLCQREVVKWSASARQVGLRLSSALQRVWPHLERLDDRAHSPKGGSMFSQFP